MSSKKNTIREWKRAFFIALFLIIILRVCILEVFTVPSSSMEKTILPGDFILVNKLAYGARMPITLLSLPFFHRYIGHTETKSYLPWLQLPYMRLPGLQTVQRNDVLVFNYPLEEEHPTDHRTYYIKRCVAIPGDTLHIQFRQVLVNGEVVAMPETVCFGYDAVFSDSFDASVFDSLQITEGSRLFAFNRWNLQLTEEQYHNLQEHSQLIHITEQRYSENIFYDFIFPYDSSFSWNPHFFGPFYVPAKNDSVVINKKNYPLYKHLLATYEHTDTTSLSLPYTHCFKQSYYFVLGDNRDNSSDSRFWGLLPEDHLVGKAAYVLFSTHAREKKLRWNRICRKIQ